jgi:hypothetical protein
MLTMRVPRSPATDHLYYAQQQAADPTVGRHLLLDGNPDTTSSSSSNSSNATTLPVNDAFLADDGDDVGHQLTVSEELEGSDPVA